MKDALKVFKRDLKSITKNPVALLIVAGVCILPSLYAWVNIKASWDPYETTSTFPVAVVNKDKGANFLNKDLNIGNDVIDNLKDNDKLGWKFVNSKEAEMGVVDGTYYAMIEIPEDFTEDLTSLTSDNPIKPKVKYKVNTKLNPVATSISNAAKGSLVNEITTNFISTVNEEVFNELNILGKNAEKNKTDILALKKAIISVNKNMDSITGLLEGVDSSAKNLGDFLTDFRATLPSITDSLSGIQDSTQSTGNIVQDTEKSFNNTIDNLQLSLKESKASIDRIYDLAERINSNRSSNDSKRNVSQISREINTLNNSISSDIKFLDEVNKAQPNQAISNNITYLNNAENALSEAKSNVENLQNSMSSTGEINDSAMLTTINSIKNVNTHISQAVSDFDSNARPALNTITNSFVSITDDACKLLETSKGLVPQMDNLLKSGAEGSELAAKISTDLRKDLLSFKDVISQLSNKLEKINDNDIIGIISVMQGSSSLMGDFISSPFELKEEPVFHVPNYGSAMTPIYSVLALWVGALILVSILKTEPPEFEGGANIRVRERHFGKLMTFVLLAVFQGAIVTLGNKLLLDVYVVNFPLMLAFGIVTSIAFTTIVFTLVSVLGNIGKDIAIVFMVIQLAGCGGTYPIQVDPKFFRVLQPFFPFTYAVGGFREAVAGPLMSSVIVDFVILIIYTILFLLIGFFFKEPLHNKVRSFEDSFKKSRVAE
ncbi:YhgE/Pip domain-containing protein [Clostridium sp. CTA-19]